MAKFYEEELKVRRDINKAMSEGSNIAQAMGKLLQEQLKTTNLTNEAIKNRASTLNDILASNESNLSHSEKAISLQSKAAQIDEKLKEARNEKGHFQEGYNQKIVEGLKTDREALLTESKRESLMQDVNELSKEKAGILMNQLKVMTGTIEKIPIIGKLITTSMGFTEDNLTKIQENLGDILQGNLEWSDLTKGIDGMTKGTIVRLGMAAAGIGAAIGLFSIFKNLMTSFSEVVDKVGAEFGVMGTQDLAGPILDARTEAMALGKDEAQLLSITKELSSNFGVSAKEAADMSLSILDSSTAMGLSAEEGAKLFGVLMQIPGLTQPMAEDLAESTYQLARANGVAPQAVMADIANSSEMIAKFGGENLESITMAAVQAAKMGLELSTISTMANSLLNFQSSVKSEMEASVMIGKQLNFQRARELALAGDMSGMMDSVVSQLGGEAEFNKLNVLQRESLAKSLGLNVEQMAKLVNEQGKLSVRSKDFTDLMGKDTMSSLTQVLNKFKTIGAELVTKMMPTLKDMAEDFQKWADGDGWKRVMSFVEGTATVLKWIAEHPKTVATLLGAMTGAAFGPWGAVIGGGAALLGTTVAGFQGLPEGHNAVLGAGAQAMAHGGESIVVTQDFKELKNQMDGLRRDMQNYFGPGGTAVSGIGRSVGSRIEREGTR